jgi:AraC-like DNA-binding protein
MLIDSIAVKLLLDKTKLQENGQVFVSDGFFMLKDFKLGGREFLVSSQPYRLLEGRIVRVLKGSACYSFNLVEYSFSAGDLVVFLADTLIEKRYHSDDFEFNALTFTADSDWNDMASGGFLRLSMTEEEQEIVDGHINLIWQTIRGKNFMPKNVSLLTRSLLLYASSCRSQNVSLRPKGSRRSSIIQRFLTLVSQHAALERTVGFYAEQLCLAPHYLCNLVKEETQKTVMDWVTAAAVKEIKVWLAFSDETIASIADRMNFSCASALTKLFKRATGQTPAEYREICYANSKTMPQSLPADIIRNGCFDV